MDLVTGLELLIGAGVVAGAWKWWPRRAEIAVPVPEFVPVTIADLVDDAPPPPAPPPVTNRMITLKMGAAIGVEPIDGVGWLGPDGKFHGNGANNHSGCAYRILEPYFFDLRVDPDPRRNFELELEQLGYVKLIRNSYFYGWTRPAKWRLTKPQKEEILNWYLMHERQMPDWLTEMTSV